MNASPPIRIAAQNVADEARAIAPGEGRRQPVEVDATALRAWLDNFSSLPPLEAEDADAQLHLSAGAQRLAVRWLGGRLGSEKSGTFVAATPGEIVADLLASARAGEKSIAPETAPASAPVAVGAESEAEPPARPRAHAGARMALLAALLAIFAALCWWHFRPEIPEGVAWIENATERDAILARAAGRYASDNERLTLDAKALLTAANEKGLPTLSTTVRVGRRGPATVFVTAGGVVLELAANGILRIDATDYRRLPGGG